MTDRIITHLQQKEVHVLAVTVDGWLSLPPRRFRQERLAEHCYRQVIRFDDMFGQLIPPLKGQRSIRVEVDLAEATATAYRRHIDEFRGVDVIVREGIYLEPFLLMAGVGAAQRHPRRPPHNQRQPHNPFSP